jgi:hypothetical protein
MSEGAAGGGVLLFQEGPEDLPAAKASIASYVCWI